MEQKKIRRFYSWVNESIQIADADSEKSTSTDDASYYNGMVDGLYMAKDHIQSLNKRTTK